LEIFHSADPGEALLGHFPCYYSLLLGVIFSVGVALLDLGLIFLPIRGLTIVVLVLSLNLLALLGIARNPVHICAASLFRLVLLFGEAVARTRSPVVLFQEGASLRKALGGFLLFFPPWQESHLCWLKPPL